MRSILSTAGAMAIVIAAACMTTAAHADASASKIQSWSDLRARYDGIVDRVAAVQKTPKAIGGGPAAFTKEEEILRVYRTPSMSDGFWSDFGDRRARAIEETARRSPRAAP